MHERRCWRKDISLHSSGKNIVKTTTRMNSNSFVKHKLVFFFFFQTTLICDTFVPNFSLRYPPYILCVLFYIHFFSSFSFHNVIELLINPRNAFIFSSPVRPAPFKCSKISLLARRWWNLFWLETASLDWTSTNWWRLKPWIIFIQFTSYSK